MDAPTAIAHARRHSRYLDRLLDAMAAGESLQQVHATLDGEGALVCEFA